MKPNGIAMCGVLRCMLIVVVAVAGLGGRGYCGTPAADDECKKRIERLLEQHDRCERGNLAVAYTVKALELADSCYGFDSEQYTEIFAYYFISDARKMRSLVCGDIYEVVTKRFNPFTDWVWQPYYELGRVMVSLGEEEKARDLFERTLHATCPAHIAVLSKLQLAEIRHRRTKENLEAMLTPLRDEIEKLVTPYREQVLVKVALSLTDYYLSEGEEDTALKYIDLGLRLTGHTSSHDIYKLLHDKYRIMLGRDHAEAVSCLERGYELLKAEGESDGDAGWIAIALVELGDYAMTERLSANDAVRYYKMALELCTGPRAINKNVMQAVGRRMIRLLSGNDDHELAIKLGEELAAYLLREDGSELNIGFVLTLAQVYVKAGRADKASELLAKYRNEISRDEELAERFALLEGEILLARGDYQGASAVFERLLKRENKIDESSRMWALRHLATAYYHLGDARTDAMADSACNIVKRIVGRQMLFISPSYRQNWIDLCNESLTHQLSMAGRAEAVKNAAEMNLFRKNLLLRTTKETGQIVASKPEARDSIALLRSLRAELATAVSRGDSARAADTEKRIDVVQQFIDNKYVDHRRLLKGIDVKISDVLAGIADDCVAVDFYSYTFRGRNRTGVFVYSRSLAPRYVELYECGDSVPENAGELIWSKLEPLISGYKDVYFCADGPLNSLAPEHAVAADGRCYSDKYRLHRMFHLADMRPACGITENVVFVGVADHNSPMPEATGATRGNWTNLRNVEMELASLRSRIEPGQLTVIYNDSATEKRFRALDNTPTRCLHISTHGVFRDSRSLSASATEPGSDDYYMARRLLGVGRRSISALILRRGNLHWNAPKISDSDDDLLTAEEIEMMHFPELQLTVLSACDSGLGEIDKEGIWGLQRALRICGTRSLICSLTKVDDYWTAQFMDAFYEQAAAGRSIYDSFHTARRWLRSELPDNPEIWSAFILIE